MRNSIRIVGVTLILLLASIGAQAGLLATSLPGSTVVYSNVVETVTGDGINGVLGTYASVVPLVTGDIMDFNPSGLGVNSSGGFFKYTDAQLDFQVKAKDGFAISDLEFAELGDYLLGGAGGTAGTYAYVTATFFVNILEIDGVAPSAPINYSVSHTFASVALPGDAGPPGIWSGDVNLDFDDIITAAGQTFESGATWVSVNLDNFMVAQSEATTTALINKKDTNGFSVTSVVVPEPASVVLLIGATSGLVFIRRRVIG